MQNSEITNLGQNTDYLNYFNNNVNNNVTNHVNDINDAYNTKIVDGCYITKKKIQNHI